MLKMKKLAMLPATLVLTTCNNLLNGLLLLTLLIGCAKKTESEILSGSSVSDGSDLTLEPYVSTFMDRLLVAGITVDTTLLEIDFTDGLPDNVLGSCTKLSGYFQSVNINRKLWGLLSAASKEELIFHELGHCLLNRDHDSTLVDGLPISIMYPYHLGPSVYATAALYHQYQAELFSVAPEVFAGYLFDPVLYGVGQNSSIQPHSVESMSAEQIYFCPH